MKIKEQHLLNVCQKFILSNLPKQHFDTLVFRGIPVNVASIHRYLIKQQPQKYIFFSCWPRSNNKMWLHQKKKYKKNSKKMQKKNTKIILTQTVY